MDNLWIWLIYPLVNVCISVENHQFDWENSLMFEVFKRLVGGLEQGIQIPHTFPVNDGEPGSYLEFPNHLHNR